MTDNIDVVVREQGVDQVEQSFDRLAASARRVHTDVAALQKLLGSVGRSTAAANRVTALGTAAQGATGHVGNLNAAMGALNANRVTANLNTANAALRGTGAAATTAAGGVRGLVGAFLGLQTIKSVVGSLIDAQISMQQIHYGLLSATGSAAGASKEFEFLSANADKLGLNLKTSAMEYTRLAASASAMNVAVEDQHALYTALSQAATVLHLDQQKVQFATLGITQMFSKGKIQAEELRRQLGEAIPGANVRFQKAVMEVIKGTDLAKYSFEQLLKKGLLNTAKFLPQLTQALQETGRGWEDAATGMNAEINRLGTAWFKLKNDLSRGLFSDATVAIVRFLSRNLQEMTGIVAGLGVALTLAFAPAAIIRFIAYMKELAVVAWAAAGPWGILAAAIAGVTVYMITMRDQIRLGTDDISTLGDAGSVVFGDLKASAGEFYNYVKDIPGFISETWALENSKIVKDNYDTTGSILIGWLTVPKAIALAFDAVAISVRSYLSGINEVIKAYIGAWFSYFEGLANVFDSAKKLDFQGMLDASASTQAAVKAGTDIRKNFDIGFAKGEGQYGWAATSYVDSIAERAQAAAKARLAKSESDRRDALLGGMKWNDGSEPAGAAAPDKKKPKKAKVDHTIENLKNKLSQLLGTIDPTQGALKKLTDADKILNDAIKSGNPDMLDMIKDLGGVEHIMGLLTEKYKDLLDPVGALNEKYDREIAALKAITPEQKAVAEGQDAMNKARKAGYDSTIQAALGEATYRRELEKTKAAELASAEASVYANSEKEKARNASTNIQALVNQKAAGNIGGGEFAVEAKKAAGLDPTILEQYKAEQEGFEQHLLAMQVLRDQYSKLASETTGKAHDDYIAAEKATNDIIFATKVEQVQSTLSIMSTGLGQIATLMGSHNKKLFKIGQAAAIAKAVVDTASGVMQAIGQWGIPWGLPFAAIAIAMGAAQISAIRSQQAPSYRTGGTMVVGGSGGTDSQLVQFNATPGERVSINTPYEARAMERVANNMESRGSRGGGDVTVNLTVNQQGRADNKTPEQNAREMRKQALKFVEA